MIDRYHSYAPFVPEAAIFNERADRDSEKMVEIKPKNILAAIMGNPLAEQRRTDNRPKDLDFDEAHYDKF